MGMQDRDWYREHHAKQNGLRYDKRNATYTARKRWSDISSSGIKTPGLSHWHFSLRFALFLVIVVAVLAALRLINSIVA